MIITWKTDWWFLRPITISKEDIVVAVNAGIVRTENQWKKDWATNRDLPSGNQSIYDPDT